MRISSLGPTVPFAPDGRGGGQAADDLAELDDDELEGLEDDLGEGDEPPEEGDEGDEDAGDEADDRSAEPPPRASTRGETRQQRLSNDLRESEARNADLQRRLEALERRSTQPPAQARETPEQLRARLDQLDPLERQAELHRLEMAELRASINQSTFNSTETADRSSFDSLLTRKPQFERYRGDVEQRLREMRDAGTTAPRETVLRWVIGDRMLAQEARATGRTRRQADQTRERQVARPARARGDVPAGDRRALSEKAARDRRVESYEL
jgi:hypothetical protein